MSASHPSLDLEAIYDEQISPLMAQILAIVKRHNLPMYASFHLGEDLVCTSMVMPAIDEAPEEFREEYAKWHRAHSHGARQINALPASPLMVTTRDGQGNITSMEAIL